jgi:hypothetical protein
MIGAIFKTTWHTHTQTHTHDALYLFYSSACKRHNQRARQTDKHSSAAQADVHPHPLALHRLLSVVHCVVRYRVEAVEEARDASRAPLGRPPTAASASRIHPGSAPRGDRSAPLPSCSCPAPQEGPRRERCTTTPPSRTAPHARPWTSPSRGRPGPPRSCTQTGAP